MNILFCVLEAGLAGHTRSATAIAQALRCRGHHVLFLTSTTENTHIFEAASFPIVRVAPDWLGRHTDITNLLPDLAAQHQIELVHSFTNAGLPQLATACKRLNIPLYHTICGGPVPARVLELRPLIVFSEELRDGIAAATSLAPEDIYVIPARVDLHGTAAIVEPHNSDVITSFRAKYSIPPDARIIMRIARLDASYLSSILHSVSVVERVHHRRRVPVCLVHIGRLRPEFGQWVFRAVRQRIEQANERCGRIVAISAQDESENAARYLNMADVVLGTGRAAFEAMVCRRPTLVMGRNGFAGLVGPQTIAELAYYNFSGRNVETRDPHGDNLDQAADAVEHLLSHSDAYNAAADFAQEWVTRTLDVHIAAKAYEEIYSQPEKMTYPDDDHIQRFRPSVIRSLVCRVTTANLRTRVRRILSGQ